ncbi:4-hydroxy-tetrahydrodipicolinate synthase [Paraliobacillus quinghaiensis]|uniref:4-hydroxy-tetrahydrodipicolinate synthase n=1 Tax=Paraliobacillus quinghaiensis TaxID=470815 RepID=A0A917TWM0_9BACI|nr:4-hydroxy-tetrahydrodipicolinate synthase [Paraliobacillus quinghaiensis]GGM41581.1 4-hydroxy-tetrahydrodipicolinate synthase [Paraliobacillus quinghaiensis]
MQFGRLLTAVVTPFDHNGNIDYVKTERLIYHLITNGTDGLVITGTTGESPTLTKEEKLAFMQFVVKYVNNRVPVIAGTGSNNTHESIALTKQAETIGVDGVMLVTPYYNKPSQEGMYQHFSAIANATTLPVMLYNIPGRSVVGLTTETIIRLSQVDNITSIKEASADLEAMTTIIRETDDNFHLYSGDDGLTLPILAIGGYGIVSVSSHIIGNEMQAMIQHHINGEPRKAAELHQNIMPIMKTLFMAPNPTAVKEALGILGVDVGSVRLPLIPLNQEERTRLEQTLYFMKKTHAG